MLQLLVPYYCHLETNLYRKYRVKFDPKVNQFFDANFDQSIRRRRLMQEKHFCLNFGQAIFKLAIFLKLRPCNANWDRHLAILCFFHTQLRSTFDYDSSRPVPVVTIGTEFFIFFFTKRGMYVLRKMYWLYIYFF